jgi:O-antigen/teichoic acid export membrane protein
MASGICAARLLGPQGRGELVAIQSWPSFLSAIAVLGMPEAVVYYSARRPTDAGPYVGSGTAIGVLSAVPFMLLGYITMPLMLHAQDPTIVWAGRWYLLLVPIYGMTVIPLSSLRGCSDFLTWNSLRLTPNVIWGVVLLLAWSCRRVSPIFVARANLVGLGILIVPFVVLVRKRISGLFLPNRRTCQAALAYGIPCMLSSVPQTLNLRLDQMLMAALLLPRDLGLYAVAVAWSGAATPLLSAIGMVTTPAVASAADDAQGVRRLVAATRLTVGLAIALCSSLALITPKAIILLFGERYRSSVPAALVLIPAAGILSVNFVLQEGLRGIGKPYAVLQAELLGLAVTAIALATMLTPMGIMGASLASVLGYSTVTIILMLKICQNTRLRPIHLLPLGLLPQHFTTG